MPTDMRLDGFARKIFLLEGCHQVERLLLSICSPAQAKCSLDCNIELDYLSSWDRSDTRGIQSLIALDPGIQHRVRSFDWFAAR